MKRRPRRDKNAPVIGGVVNGGRGDTTRVARARLVKRLLSERVEVDARQTLVLPRRDDA